MLHLYARLKNLLLASAIFIRAHIHLSRPNEGYLGVKGIFSGVVFVASLIIDNGQFMKSRIYLKETLQTKLRNRISINVKLKSEQK
jgi:hypothetical protein